VKRQIRTRPPLSTALTSPPNAINNPLTPRRARLATDIPVTAPPLNATSSAFAMPSFAALAQRTLLLTEMFMPRYPAAADITAPRMNPMAVSMLIATPIRTASMTRDHCHGLILPVQGMPLRLPVWQRRWLSSFLCLRQGYYIRNKIHCENKSDNARKRG